MKNFLIAPAHYRVYRSASRRLFLRIGADAPSAEKLIQHELSQRSPRLIADDYLESTGWRRWPARRSCLRSRLPDLKPTAGDPRRN
jgi:hypothetical protein